MWGARAIEPEAGAGRSRAVYRTFRLAGLTLLALGLAGCALTRQARAPAPVGDTGTAARLMAALAERDRELVSLSAGALMEYSGGAGHFKAREQILVRRPQSLRVEALSAFGVVAVVASDGSQLQVFEPSKNTLIRGAADAGTLERFARIPMPPAAAVVLLMGLVPGGPRAPAGKFSVSAEENMTVVVYPLEGGGLREIGFADGRLAMVRERRSRGVVSYEVRYDDYRNIGGIMFPYRLAARFPAAKASLELRYDRPLVNVAAPDAMFVLTPGPSTKELYVGGGAAPASQS